MKLAGEIIGLKDVADWADDEKTEVTILLSGDDISCGTISLKMLIDGQDCEYRLGDEVEIEVKIKKRKKK